MRLAAAAVLAAAWPGMVFAGAWPLERGGTQVIVKAERMRASEGFEIDGVRRPLLAGRDDDAVSIFAEHGLTDRLTLQVRAEFQRGDDTFADYEGNGPTEIGLRYQVLYSRRTTVSLYGAYARAGEGRNAGYAAPGAGDHDWEVRLLAGHSGSYAWLGRRDAFAEVQIARRIRDGLADEDHLDVTLGVHLNDDWMLLSQIYAGRTVEGPAVRWVNSESSIVRRWGDWSLQVGWRQALSGRGEVPAQQGPVLAVWRRF
ncbi:MAG TPA: hypothetical protein PLE81_07140 [Brevundimonas sp.]|uniref:hypothetical protein n=1 Tax=Brevundimonas sp. TaxID=1871086 RepID=UPI002C4EDF56|nr:hypothetical protein [Brevundimonas sp.]HRH20399.1 hypothetical protein [Brevundimonas sp.]